MASNHIIKGYFKGSKMFKFIHVIILSLFFFVQTTSIYAQAIEKNKINQNYFAKIIQLGISSAYAEVDSSTESETSSEGKGIAQPNVGANSASENKTTFTETPDYKTDKEKTVMAKEAMNWVIILAVVLSAPITAAICFTRIDTKLHLAFSLAYLITEIVAFAMYEGTSTAEFKYVESATQEEQLKVFEAAVAITDKKLLVAKIRMGAQFAFGALELVAAIVSFVMAGKEVAASTLATGLCAPVAGSCPISPSCAPTATNMNYKNIFNSTLPDENINPLDGYHNSDIASYGETLKDSPSDAHSYFLMAESEILRGGGYQNYSYDTAHEVMDLSTEIKQHNYLKEYMGQVSEIMSKIGDFFIPQSFAESYDSDKWKALGPLIGITSVALIAAIGVIVATYKSEGQKLLSINGWARGAWYSTISVIAMAAGATTVLAYKNTEEEKTKYESLVKRIKAIQKRGALGVGDASTTQNINFAWPQNIPGVGPTTENIQNITCDKESAYQKAVQCKCSGETCKVNAKSINYQGSIQAPKIQGALSSTTDGINGLMSGDLQTADLSNQQVGQYAAGFKSDLDKVKEKVNLTLKSHNAAPIDFKKLDEKMMEKVYNDTNNAVASLSGDQRKALLDFASGRAPESAAPTNDLAEKEDKESETKVAASSPGASANVTPDDGKKELNGLFDLFKEEKPSKSKNSKGNEAESQNPKKEVTFKYNVNDISGRSKTSIFKIIEIRYFKTAFPLFFDEKKK